jgi:hypothetical protein
LFFIGNQACLPTGQAGMSLYFSLFPIVFSGVQEIASLSLFRCLSGKPACGRQAHAGFKVSIIETDV